MKLQKAAGELQKLQAARARLEQSDVDDHAKLAKLRVSLPDVAVTELLGLEQAIESRKATRRALMARIRAAVQAEAHARAEALRKSTSMRLACKTAQLLQQADAIEAAAAQQCQGGQVAGNTLAELLGQIGDDPIAPSTAVVVDWFERRAAAITLAWEQKYIDTRIIPRPVFMATLAWSPDAEILPSSYVAQLGVSAIHVEE